MWRGWHGQKFINGRQGAETKGVDNRKKKRKPVKGLIIWCSINLFVLIILNNAFNGAGALWYIYMLIVAICLVVRLVNNSNLPKGDKDEKIASGEFTVSDAVLPSERLINKQRETDEIIGDKKELNEMFQAGESLRSKATAAGKRVVSEVKKASEVLERGITKATDRVASVLKNLANKDKASLAQQSPMLKSIAGYTKAEKQYDLFCEMPKQQESFNIDNANIKHIYATDFDEAKSNTLIIINKDYLLKPKNYKTFYTQLNRNRFNGFADKSFMAQYEDFKQMAGVQAVNRQNQNMNILGTGGFNMLENLTRFDNETANNNVQQNTAQNATTKAIPSVQQVFGNVGERNAQQVFGDIGAHKATQVFDEINDNGGQQEFSNVGERNTQQAFKDFGGQGILAADSASTIKKGTVKKEDALNYYLNLVQQGDESANYNVGYCYDFGYGTQVDKKLAVDYYRKAAAVGVAAAENNLALKYDTAEGTYLNKPEAVRLYLSAAQKGDTDAMFNIGNKYIYGDGIAVNVTEGIKFLAQSADSGNAKAANCLGWVYYSGAVARKNIDAASKWFMAAALGGNVMGMYNYALILSDQTNENFNKNEAKYWLKKASEKGLAAATKMLEKLNVA